MRVLKGFIVLLVVFLLSSQPGFGQDVPTRKEQNRMLKNYLLTNKPWSVEIPLWIPGFAGSFAYGEASVEGEDGKEIGNPIEPVPPPNWKDIFSRIFSTKWYLKFFFMTRVSFEKNWFMAQFDMLSGAVGESTRFKYNQQEVVQVNFRTTNARIFIGYKFLDVRSKNNKFNYKMFGYLGARTFFHKIYSDLDGVVNKLDINPVWVEPIMGIAQKFSWKRWQIQLLGDYGGYFVPDKKSVQLSGVVFFRSGRITSLKFGWNHLVLQHKGTFLGENYKAHVSLSGPSIGIALHF